MAGSIADPATAALRRNGKKSSCEPCRKSKLSCDHIRPTCGRCQRRRAPERCVYHPAPMTNGQRPSPSSIIEKQTVREDVNDDQQPVATSSLGNDPTALMTLREDRLIDASPPLSGFLGSTSYSAVFTEGQSHIIIEDNNLSHETNNRGSQPSKLPSWDSSKVMEGAEILTLLAGLSRYEAALNQWYKVQCLATITHYIRECIALVPPELKGSHVRSKSLVNLSHKVFLRTSTPCSLDVKMSLREYPSFLMGENFCWEIVGLMLTALGLSAISMDEVQISDECDSQTNWKDLALQLLRAGDQCMVFCEQFGHLKDIGVTLILMNFILHTQVYGDAGEYTEAMIISRDCSHMS